MIHFFWYLPPLFMFVGLVYSATKYDEWPAIFRDALWWQIRLLVFLASLGLVIYLFTRFF